MLGILEKPYPASKKSPFWLKRMPTYIGRKKAINDNGVPNYTIKNNYNITDALNIGYYIPLHSDVSFKTEKNYGINVKWAWNSLKVVHMYEEEETEGYPLPDSFEQVIFKWGCPWIIKTPPGWSCLFTHPMHQDNLPFKSIPIVVDTDKYPKSIEFPFLLEKDFSGLIEKGTPIIQVIPFKREKVISEFSYDFGFFKNQWKKASSIIFDRYKKLFRSEKTYEQGSVKNQINYIFK